MNLADVAGLPSRSITGIWCRAVNHQHLPTALNTNHTRSYPSRYYGGPAATAPFEILYLAEDQQVAKFEVGALFGSPLSPGGVTANLAQSWDTVNVEVQLTRVADLTDVRGSQMLLSTTVQELTGDWKGYLERNANTSVSAPIGLAPTHELGAALHSGGFFEGFLTVSAKMPIKMVLGIFPDRVFQGNFIRYSHTDTIGETRTLQIP